MLKKIISLFLSLSLIITQPIFAQGVAQLNLAQYLGQARLSAIDNFRPTQLRYFSYDNLNDSFRILLDKGDAKDIKDNQLKEEAKELMDYFLIGLTLPNDAFWVNLRPDSPDNIIDPELEKTDLGRILLEADLQLKKDTAGLTSPQTPEGKAYWDKLYKKAGELFGTENITIPTITRPWIVPGEIIVRESHDSAYIYKATLKVLLEQDHLKDSSVYNFSDPRLKELNEYSSQIIRETIIPKLTQEVNSSKRYAQLRQVYYSLVLSRWFKQKYSSLRSTRASARQSASADYISRIDSGDLTNLTAKEPYDKLAYFKQYQESFAQGEYNLKEPVYTPYGQSIRTYMSGGFNGTKIIVAGVNAPKTVGSSIVEESLENHNNIVSLKVSGPGSRIELSDQEQPLALAASPMRINVDQFYVFANNVSLLSGPNTGSTNIGNTSLADGSIINHPEWRNKIEKRIEDALGNILHNPAYETEKERNRWWESTLKNEGVDYEYIKSLNIDKDERLSDDRISLELKAHYAVNKITNLQLKKIIDFAKGHPQKRTTLYLGERLWQREKDMTTQVLERDIAEILEGITAEDMGEIGLKIAYEPRDLPKGISRDLTQVEKDHSFIKKIFQIKFKMDIEVYFVIGLTPENANSILALPSVDGAGLGASAKEVDKLIPYIKAAIEEGKKKGRPLTILMNWKAENNNDTGLEPLGNFTRLFKNPEFDWYMVNIAIATPNVYKVKMEMLKVKKYYWEQNNLPLGTAKTKASEQTNDGYVVNDADREKISSSKVILDMFSDDGEKLIKRYPDSKELYEETEKKLKIYWKTEEAYDIQKAAEAALEFYFAIAGIQSRGLNIEPEIENKIKTLQDTGNIINGVVEKLKSLIGRDIAKFRKIVNTEVDPNELDELKRELSLKNSKATVTYILFLLSDQFKPYHNIPGFFIEESKERYNGIKNELKIFDFPVASSALFLSEEEKRTITDIKKKIDSFPRAYAEWRLKSKHQEQFFGEMIRYRSADINQAGNDIELVISKIKSFLKDSKFKDEQFEDERFAIPELERLEDLIKGVNNSITNKMREEFEKLSIKDESKVKEFNAFLEKNWLAAAADYAGNVILRDSNDASAKEWRQLVKDIVFYRLGSSQKTSSSGITSELEISAFPKNPLGGIDFTGRAMKIGLEPMGSFADLKLVLPEVANAAAINLDNEFKQIQLMASSGIRPSDIRILEFAAACYYRGEFGPRLGEITSCLQQAHFLDERLGRESSPALRLATMLPEVMLTKI